MSKLWRLGILMVVLLLGVYAASHKLVGIFIVPSRSMEPTLQSGDRLLAVRPGEIKRGDVVVFVHPPDSQNFLVKRAIGLPGDRIRISQGKLYLNGKLFPEPYINEKNKMFGRYKSKVIPENHLFVMGDNRNLSQDSRDWGPIPRKSVVGKCVLLFWPPGRIGFIR